MGGAAISNNLFDIWSTPVALPKSTVVNSFSTLDGSISRSLKLVLVLGGSGISEASFLPIAVKCALRRSAISFGLLRAQ